MTILVIDGQGGRIGGELVAGAKARFPAAEVLAVGTNSSAAQLMRKAGADLAASGENAVCVACRRADYILGPLGIVVADAMLGEITPAMAAAVGSCRAAKILLPLNRCELMVAGVARLSISALIADALDRLAELAAAGA